MLHRRRGRYNRSKNKFTISAAIENNDGALPSEIEKVNSKMKMELAIDLARKILEKNIIKLEVRKSGQDTNIEFFGSFYIIEEKDLIDFIRRYI